MSHRLEPLLREIEELEQLVSEKIQHATESFPFEIKHGKPVFGLETRLRHRALAKRIGQFLRDSTVLTILTTPVIYSILIPIALLDLLVSVYQAVCFPIYLMPRVRRREYIAVDRHRLEYLNIIERINCAYCGYANGVLAYAREIASRTEQYWCPIKHARRMKGCHSRQCLFCEYGDAEGFRLEYEALRKQLTEIECEKPA